MKLRMSPALRWRGPKPALRWKEQSARQLTTRAVSRGTLRSSSTLSNSVQAQKAALVSSPGWGRLPASPRRSQTTLSSGTLPRVLVNDMANQELIVDFNTGTALRYPSFWLRDHCHCPACQHPSTHQRLLDTFTIDPEIKVSSVQPTPSGLEVTWPTATATSTSTESGQTHTSVYPWEWLETHPPFMQTSKTQTTRPPPTQRNWTHVSPTSSLPRVPYSSIMSTSSNDGLTKFLESIHTNGLCFIPGTPANPAATQELIERIAHIRATHYGGFWDFTSEPNPIDTAYTNDYLPPHTDNTYFTDPAGLQLFHLLSHTALEDTSQVGKGGESTFVDGFAAASHLYTHFPQHYQTLSTYPITSAALGAPEGSFLNTAASAPGYPVFRHSAPPSSSANHHAPSSPSSAPPRPANLVQIRWNNLDRLAPAAPSFPNHTALKAWYTAAREWARILESPEFLLTVKLGPGEPVIFDNWRVLHGRLAFEGARRVCGAYVGMDDFRARCRSLGIDA